MPNHRWKRVFAKLRNMDRREFLFRARQEVAKRSDTLLAAAGHDFAAAPPLTPAPAKSGAFFFSPEQVEDLLRMVRERLPETGSRIVERAHKICQHRFDLLGYESLQYGASINWQLDAVHQKLAPKKPFYLVKYLDFSEVGDSKITWELNRHQHLVTLAKAYRFSGEERFAREIIAQWQSWHSQNPYPTGINWASSLELAFRSISWIWMHALLEGTPFLTADFENQYLRSQSLNGRHIERYLSTYFSPNTHLLGEAVALFFLGTACTRLRDAERWKSIGWRIVLEQAGKQINPDGMHFEQSVYYHVYALDFFLHAALLASANGMELPKAFEQAIERMMNALFLLARGGPPPRFGDDDGGRLFDPSRNHDEHLVDPLATGAILFQRGNYKSLARELREETIWLLGAQGVAAWDALETQPVQFNSAALESGGIFVSAVPRSKAQLIIKGGPSAPQTRGHAHADALSLCVHAFGNSLLIDPGACEYVGEAGRRDLYRGTPVHNTLLVDNANQSEPDDPFSWKQEIAAKTERWISGESFDLFVGSHAGYRRFADPVTHRRWLVALKTGIFLIRDLVEGDGEHRLDISWRLSPDLHMAGKDDFRLKQSSRGLAIVTAQKHGWSEEVHKGPWSPVYGAQRMTTVLKFGRNSRLPAEFATALVSLADAGEVPGQLSLLHGTKLSPAVSGYRYEAAGAAYEFFFAQSGRWASGQIASDAEFVCVTTRQAQQPDITFCNGSFVELEGRRVLETHKRVQRCELVVGESTQIFCSDPGAIANSISEKTAL